MPSLANGTAPHKKELSWEQVATGNFPPHDEPTEVDEQHHQFFQQAVAQAAATMDTPPYNDQKGKLHKAMDLVLTR